MLRPDASSTRPTPPPVPRAAVFAVVSTVLGVSAHHLMAEGPVPWAQSGVAAVVLFAVALLGLIGAQRARPLPRVVAFVAAAQGALHLWLTVSAPHAPAAAAHPMGSHHAHGAHATWHEHLAGGDGPFGASIGMTVAHALAALAVAVLMQRADAACWTLARGFGTATDALRARIGAPWALLAGAVTARRRLRPSVLVPVCAARPPPRRPVLADVVVRRGPPSPGVFLAS
ncbi:hypothetical protein [Streptomyces sp. NBC_00498]